MAIKLDLEKAYDRVSWDFICAYLMAIGIPEFLQKVIISAISSSSMHILWNGVPTQKFKPVRGIRQGCPLSPYLFVLRMDWLKHIVRSNIDIGRWEPIQLSKIGPAISHMFFADDLEVQNLGTYLGVFLLHNRVTKNTLSFVVDKGCADGHPKLPLVGWDSICQPQPRGRLGFWHLSDQNMSFLMKIGFNLVSKSNTLWGVLRSKYGWKEQIPKTINKSQCSHLWRSLSKIWPLLRENLTWAIGDGASVHCWKDSWIPDSGADKVIWARSMSGAFTVPSAFRTLKEDTWSSLEENWKTFWKYQGPQIRLLTNLERTRRGIGQSNSYTVCGHEYEDMAHVLRDFLAAKDVWMHVLPNHLKQRFFSDSFRNISWSATEVVKVSISWVRQFESYFSGYKSNISNLNLVNISDNTWAILSTDGVVGRETGYKRTIIQTDNLEVVQTLTDLGLEDPGITVFRRTQRIMKFEGQWRINHIPREQKVVADRLAKFSLNWKST
ncbi:LINE-1 reverse transcriptase isogeny [Gossypium australe]|uniref:LINE-1 reverse transcriptase isogeny n=1 Tax=Gossypium australe TaxID=47621 RepID=A0A5B6WZ87_9ROSI|nr:LINE-1 reverse transcriptase isogeny [Gossypium australe]